MSRQEDDLNMASASDMHVEYMDPSLGNYLIFYKEDSILLDG